MLRKLSELQAGSTGTLREYPARGAAFIRLREMGLLPGTAVTFVRTAPLGDPIEIKIRGYSLSLRRSEADQVVVEVADA